MLHGFIFAHTNVTFAPLLHGRCLSLYNILAHIVTSNLVLLAEVLAQFLSNLEIEDHMLGMLYWIR